MKKEGIEMLLGCPIEKLPMGVAATISVNSHGHKGTFQVLRVVVMEDHTYPYIEFLFGYPSGRVGKSQCFVKDYGLTWAKDETDWESAKKYREEMICKEPEKEEFKPGEAFVYRNGDRYEIGIVKRKNPRMPGSYFCWYHMGDTAACTDGADMHKIANGYAFRIVRLSPEGRERENKKGE